MRRRISRAIVGVSVFVVLLLGVPLAIVAQRQILDREVVRTQAAAARMIARVEIPIDVQEFARETRSYRMDMHTALYGPDGVKVSGPGPARADAVVRRALGGQPAASTRRAIVVASPVVDRTSDAVIGAVRVATPREPVDSATHRAWLAMLAAIGLVLLVAWLVARRLAASLSRPVTDLAEVARRVGDGEVAVARPSTGIDEIDTLAASLVAGSQRVGEALARERRFTADVSHQLRTPITRLRLRLEEANLEGDAEELAHAEADLDRLEETVDHLLALARDAAPPQGTTDLAAIADAIIGRWADPVRRTGRRIEGDAARAPVVAVGGSVAIDQVVEVLVDNAVRHGVGTIRVTVRRIAGGAAIDVTDAGTGIADGDRDRIFGRREGRETGIGLALARSIAEAEGGRLLLIRTDPTTFSLILRSPEEP